MSEIIRALVVDDNEVNVLVLENMLKAIGISVDSVYDGLSAVEKAVENAYDIIFMDHLMPDTDGVQTTQLIRENGVEKSKTAIIGLTANLSDNLLAVFVNAGAQDALAKPLDMDSLKKCINKWTNVNVASESESSDEDSDEMKFIEQLGKQCNDIDIREGLKYSMDSAKHYYKVLTTSVKNISECLASIGEIGYSDMKSLNIAIHSLKGIFANIGATEHFKTAKALEDAYKGEDYEYVQENLPAFSKTIASFQEMLEQLLLDYEQNRRPEEELPYVEASEEEKRSVLEEAIEALKMFDIDTSVQRISQFASYNSLENRSEILRAKREAEDFNYDAALDILIKLYA